MEMRTLVGDQFGRIIGELRPRWSSFAWRLGEIDKASFSIAKTDDKATETFLQYGNRIITQFDNGLPNWGGTIETPTKWSESEIDITCYGIEYLLQFRTTAKTRAFSNEQAGHIYNKILAEVEQAQSVGLTFGYIWTGGRLHSPRYHFKSAWWIIKDSLMKLENCDAYFLPYISDGYIRFRAELHEELGEDKSLKRALSEGKNARVAEFTEQGTIINEFAAVGAGTTWGEERVYEVASERDSRVIYGLRQNSKVYSNVTIPSTLVRYAQTAIEADANPHTRIKLDVTDNAPAEFRHYDLGDELQCVLPTYGFDGYDNTVRVISREFVPAEGICGLVVEESHTTEIKYSSGQEEVE